MTWRKKLLKPFVWLQIAGKAVLMNLDLTTDKTRSRRLNAIVFCSAFAMVPNSHYIMIFHSIYI
jgi:hypothetical protein